ncbi:MAG: hypothetical protein R3189_10040, partial [Thiomicrorhabdus chilensis]|uniref:hypothetical protein n=1 Tax=Thiomicrorhabdus chilensis TaxID=63656 RepID=UPI00299EB72E
TWKGQINRLGRGKIISIDDEFLVLQTVDGEYKVVVHYKDIQIPLSREGVATCRAEVSLTSSSLPEVPEHVQKEFEAHRITIIDVDESSRSEVHLLAALDRAIERTRDISPLIVDDRLPFYFSLPGGYLRNEEQFFYYVIEFPKAGAKINQLVLNVLAFAGFERLKFQNNAPVFLEAAKLLGEYFPQYIDTALEYMRRAFQHHQTAVSGELIPALYNAYRFRPEFERIKTVCQKVGFREADVPFIRLSGEKVSLLTHSGLWNRVVSVGGYEQPYFIFIELIEGQYPEDIKADEIENGSLDLFGVNETSLLIVGELSSVAEVNTFLKGLDGNLPERSQITVYAHNPLSDPIETLSKLEVVRRKAETDLCSSSWFVFNDFTTQRPIWPGVDGYNVYPREYIE